MEETEKLIEEIYSITNHFSQMTKYERYDIGIKILALQEQRKINANLDSIENRLRRIEITLLDI